ncbi:MAG: hypothetical protein K1X65_05720 [Caldilineales bacterium]|nr:hypothetical protein [Caldilineales bacterium]MCW5860408.1 hypothetical protein [Caldilineales bacterium]
MYSIDVVEFETPNTLTLPPAIARRFRPADRFVVWMEGDTLHLKRMFAPSPTELVAEAPEGEPLLLSEINEIVHEVRRQRHNQ